MVVDQARLEQRLAGIIRSAIESHHLSEDEMLSRGIDLIIFARNYNENVIKKE